MYVNVLIVIQFTYRIVGYFRGEKFSQIGLI